MQKRRATRSCSGREGGLAGRRRKASRHAVGMAHAGADLAYIASGGQRREGGEKELGLGFSSRDGLKYQFGGGTWAASQCIWAVGRHEAAHDRPFSLLVLFFFKI